MEMARLVVDGEGWVQPEMCCTQLLFDKGTKRISNFGGRFTALRKSKGTEASLRILTTMVANGD
jgi:hypothetical protein